MAKAAKQSKRIQPEFESLFALFAFLVSLREDVRAQRQRYADKNGFILVRDDEGRDFCYLRRRPYDATRNAALVATIAAEPDVDDWSKLRRLHAEQREVVQ